MKIFNDTKFYIVKKREHIEVYKVIEKDRKTTYEFAGSYDNINEAEKELEKV
jgi:hypothetical protein